MKNATHRLLLSVIAATMLPSLASAHPGHDGHELTWDFRHLVAYPGATALWLAILAAAAWAIVRIASAVRRGRRR